MRRVRSIYLPTVAIVLLALLLVGLAPAVALAVGNDEAAVQDDVESVQNDEDEVEDEDADQDEDDVDDDEAPDVLVDDEFCDGTMEFDHPVAEGIADRYEGIDYPTVKEWLCQGFGFGSIMLALHTEEMTEEMTDSMTAADALKARLDGDGWGQIWLKLKLIGHERDAGPPPWAAAHEDGEQTRGLGRPEHAGQPAWARTSDDGEQTTEEADRPGNAGPPEWAGPPSERANADDTGGGDKQGPPEWAGPQGNNGRPDHAGPANAGPPGGKGRKGGGRGGP